MTKIGRLGIDTTPRTHGTLIERTEAIIRMFDNEDKTFAFGDSGDAEMYAAEMADLLEQWAEAHQASIARHPSNQETDEISTPSLPSIERQRRQRHRQGDWP
jgi:hypothetical protein